MRASITIEGRSFTVLEEIHPLALNENPAIHKAFMQRLKAMLPEENVSLLSKRMRAFAYRGLNLLNL